ncbi:MAG: hypothetical protein RXQ22_07840 [Sulfolobus sp.]
MRYSPPFLRGDIVTFLLITNTLPTLEVKGGMMALVRGDINTSATR